MMLGGLEHSGLPLFLVGSVCFAFAAATTSPHYGRLAVTAGLKLFLVGRVMFVRGSQTDLCDIFFRTSWRFNTRDHQWLETNKHWYGCTDGNTGGYAVAADAAAAATALATATAVANYLSFARLLCFKYTRAYPVIPCPLTPFTSYVPFCRALGIGYM